MFNVNVYSFFRLADGCKRHQRKIAGIEDRCFETGLRIFMTISLADFDLSSSEILFY